MQRKEFNSQLDDFILAFVLPECRSPMAFLRARACSLISSLAATKFSKAETIQVRRLAFLL